jgi:hypothetical protein
VCTTNTKGEKKSSISESESYGNSAVEIVTSNTDVALFFVFFFHGDNWVPLIFKGKIVFAILCRMMMTPS